MDLQSIVLENIEVYVSGFIVLGGALFYYLQRLKNAEKKLEEKIHQVEEKIEAKLAEKKVPPVEIPKVSWTDRLSMGLSKSRSEVWGKIGNLFSGPTPALDEIEEVLYTADIPTGMVQQLLGKLESDGKGKSAAEIQDLV